MNRQVKAGVTMWNANKKEQMVRPQFDVDALNQMVGITSRA